MQQQRCSALGVHGMMAVGAAGSTQRSWQQAAQRSTHPISTSELSTALTTTSSGE